ncbi:MAG: hypothetical protein M1820_009636 [Bogoriella megaspora]|nr:MAG: hypothetical protein M1820_009636 [Bogoriella megaspora]
MKFPFNWGLAASSQTIAPRGDTCCFSLTANGGPGGKVGQLFDGQNRFGDSGLSPGSYCIDGKGGKPTGFDIDVRQTLTFLGLTDDKHRGCILTEATTQFQCDDGAAPSSGFSVGCDGNLTSNGSPKFAACPTEKNGGYNIYTSAPANQQGCVEITLTADKCKAGCPASPSAVPPPPAPSPPTCPAALTGTWEFPHLIIPVDASSPDKPLGTSYFGSVNVNISSLFNFDIPASHAGKKCSLIFLLPSNDKLETSSYHLSGNGAVNILALESSATGGTTYDNRPPAATDFGATALYPDNSYVIATFDCQGGQRVGYEMQACGNTEFRWFQDYNPAPIGLYLTVC